MKQEAIPFRGIIPPFVTPFRPDEELDEEGLRREVAFHLEAGVHGVSVSGSTGEGGLLRDEELRRVWTMREGRGEGPGAVHSRRHPRLDARRRGLRLDCPRVGWMV